MCIRSFRGATFNETKFQNTKTQEEFDKSTRNIALEIELIQVPILNEISGKTSRICTRKCGTTIYNATSAVIERRDQTLTKIQK